MDAFIKESQNPQGFTPQGLNIAAAWCLQNNYGLDKGLEWATLRNNPRLSWRSNFFSRPIDEKAELLDKVGKADEAAAVIKTALHFGHARAATAIRQTAVSCKET